MRSAWVMTLKPGHEAEYKRKHDEIWPEMVELLKRQGIRNYTIYQHGLTLFAYNERDDNFPVAAESEPNEVIRRWWLAMAPHMETTGPYHAPVAERLTEIFRLD